jgi:hypothetical protein
MKIIYSSGGEYGDCIVKHFDLMPYNNDFADTVLFWGWNSIDRKDLQFEFESYRKKYFINTAQPCEIINGYDEILKQGYFDEVFTICPYSAIVLNTTAGAPFKTFYTPICFPFRESKFKKYDRITLKDKLTDVIYYGNIHSPMYIDLINTICKFNYAFSTIGKAKPKTNSHVKRVWNYFKKQIVKNIKIREFNSAIAEIDSLITHYDLTSEEKWDLLSRSKISVGINLLFINNHHIQNLKSTPNIDSFEKIDVAYEKHILPQMKTRMVEAAACKSLMLLYKDDWNVVENWFEPNKHFLYWETFDELQFLITEISNNYEKYWHIVEAANEHVKQYSIENLMQRIN